MPHFLCYCQIIHRHKFLNLYNNVSGHNLFKHFPSVGHDLFPFYLPITMYFSVFSTLSLGWIPRSGIIVLKSIKTFLKAFAKLENGNLRIIILLQRTPSQAFLAFNCPVSSKRMCQPSASLSIENITWGLLTLLMIVQ